MSTLKWGKRKQFIDVYHLKKSAHDRTVEEKNERGRNYKGGPDTLQEKKITAFRCRKVRGEREHHSAAKRGSVAFAYLQEEFSGKGNRNGCSSLGERDANLHPSKKKRKETI